VPTAPQPVGTIKKPWSKEAQSNYTGSQVDYFDFIDATTPGNPPATSTGSGRYVLSDSGEFNQIKALFYGEGTAGTSKAAVRVWAVSRVQVSGVDKVDYVGELLGELTITLGAGPGTTGGEFASKKFVDKITVTTDASNLPPGIRISGDVSGKAASLMIDAAGYAYVIIEIKNDGTNPFTPNGVGVVWRVL